jgi:HD-GYP domain-containing protein (c-di-GMP phosphodiesterase class II)
MILLKELKATGELDMAFVRKITGELFDLFERLPPAEFLDLRYPEKRRLPRHCINVSKLAMVLAREMGLGRDEIEQAAICGLLHDAGMAREKETILSGSPPEEQEEWRRTRGHPAGGQILLTKEAVLRNVVSRVSPEHAASPAEGKKERVHLYARMVNVVDTYEALVSPRAGRPAQLPHKALQGVMDAGAQGMLDWDLVRLFVRALSVYPIGSYLRLQGGELARVVRTNPEIPEKPVIAILADAQGNALQPPVEVDLAMAEPPAFEPVASPP